MGLSDANRFSVSDFSEIFRIRNQQDLPYLLIGGQAINYWAERYLRTEPELQEHLPFTSEDIDFKGTKLDVERIADQLGRKAIFPRRVEMTALAGSIPILLGDTRSNIEIVRRVPGVIDDQLEATAIDFEIHGIRSRVVQPILLVAAKLYLACKVPQEKRQDVKHLKIIIICARAFLRDVLADVEAGRIDPDPWLAAVNKLHKLATSTQGRKAAKHFGIDWSKCLPMTEITAAKNKKIVGFRELQLPRIQRH
jgi:hypothetical protein